MKGFAWMSAAVLAVAVAVPVFAGGSEEKCTESVEACLAHFAEKADNYGWVGIELDRDEESGLMTVSRVVEKSPAEKAGFKVGDVLYALNGVELNSENKEKLKAARGEWKPGSEVTYTVKRNDKESRLAVVLGEVPQDVLAQWIGQHMLSDHMEIAQAQ